MKPKAWVKAKVVIPGVNAQGNCLLSIKSLGSTFLYLQVSLLIQPFFYSPKKIPLKIIIINEIKNGTLYNIIALTFVVYFYILKSLISRVYNTLAYIYSSTAHSSE